MVKWVIYSDSHRDNELILQSWCSKKSCIEYSDSVTNGDICNGYHSYDRYSSKNDEELNGDQDDVTSPWIWKEIDSILILQKLSFYCKSRQKCISTHVFWNIFCDNLCNILVSETNTYAR